jgi:hypothetical protein
LYIEVLLLGKFLPRFSAIFPDRLCDATVAVRGAYVARAGSFLMRVRSPTGADDGALAHFSMPPSALGKRIRTMHVARE